jgi:sulfoxide reductase heme-binding subunit YedZ
MINIIKKIIFQGELFISKKTIGIICYYIIPIILFNIFLFSYLLFFDVYKNGFWEFNKMLGEKAFTLFFLILIVKPLSKIFPKIKLFSKFRSLRREFGVLLFWLSFLHSLGLLLKLNILSFDKFLQSELYIIFGVISLIGMLILAITSNKFSVIKLKRNWKKLHRITYLVFVLVVIHAFLITEHYVYFIYLFIFLILKIFEIKKNQN